MSRGKSPIYEPGLEELMVKNIEAGRLEFTTEYKKGLENVGVIYIAVGTPENADGSSNLTYIEQVVELIGKNLENDVILVTKSTVPVGTNHYIREKLISQLSVKYKVEVVSNPEFLREGSSLHDTFNGDRIVIGSDNEDAGNVIEEINKPFGIPVYKTDVKSAEMIKYASNAFLATKISFINEIANICEKLGADVESVAKGMGMDERIGSRFLSAGIGYGGSCFPKDTKALTQIAANLDHNFELLKAVIEVNNYQQTRLVTKALERFHSLDSKKVAVLGLSFKPDTDDMREAASIVTCHELIDQGAEVTAYDPIANEKAQKVLPKEVSIMSSLEEAISNADMVFILTDWNEFKTIDLNVFIKYMKRPIIFDGRNIYSNMDVSKYSIEYHSIGRQSVMNVSE